MGGRGRIKRKKGKGSEGERKASEEKRHLMKIYKTYKIEMSWVNSISVSSHGSINR